MVLTWEKEIRVNCLPIAHKFITFAQKVIINSQVLSCLLEKNHAKIGLKKLEPIFFARNVILGGQIILRKYFKND